MRQEPDCDRALELVEKAVRRFESEAGSALAPVFYLSLNKAPGPERARPTVRLEWMSEAAQFQRAARAMQPLLGSLRQRTDVREIVLVECEENYDGARCKGETWFLEFAG